jgi:hypothetical protein
MKESGISGDDQNKFVGEQAKEKKKRSGWDVLMR